MYTNSLSNAYQSNGMLNIVALRDSSAANGWTSARVNTLGLASFFPGMQTQVRRANQI